MPLSSQKIQLLPRFSLNLAANIIAAVWMLLGSIKAFLWVKPTFSQFVIFALTALGVNILFAWLASDLGSDFNSYGLISYLIWPTIMLIAGILLANRTHNYALLFVPAILWLVADTLLILMQSGFQFLIMQNWLPGWLYANIQTVFTLLFVWQTASLLWIFAKRLHWPWWEQLIMLFGAIALLIVWQKNVANQPIYKIKHKSPVIEESAFYDQPRILTDALASIEKGDDGKTDWYFAGVAGYAQEDVFKNEIFEAKQLFDVRFGTKGHSITLINNTATWQDQPVATKTSLKQALNAIGKAMQTDEDVLFLAISSHGTVSEDGVIIGDSALSNPPLELEDISPKWLKQTLDESGIRWRVIVVSSCYSGVFIKELASPTTAVITASRDDRASFGCGHDADLSYFGRAFFAQSLRSQNSLEQAYKEATKRIGEKEALLGFEPSEPQMFIGSLMKTALPQFETELFNHTNATQNSNTPKTAVK